MENKKIKTTKEGNIFLAYVQKGIDCNWQVSEKKFIMYVGGILSKLENTTQFFYLRGRGWVGI